MELLIKKIVYSFLLCSVVLLVPSVLRADLEDIEESQIPDDEPFLLKEQNKIKKSEQNPKKNTPVLKQDRHKSLVPPTVKNGRVNNTQPGKQDKKKQVKSGKRGTKPETKLKWEASSLKADRNNKYIDLKKEVKLTQGDLLITSDEAIIYFDNNSQVVRAEASGNVYIQKGSGQEQISAKSGKAVFYVKKRKILLTENPIVWKQIDVIRGTSISYDVDSGMVTVSKVEGILESKMQEDSEK